MKAFIFLGIGGVALFFAAAGVAVAGILPSVMDLGLILWPPNQPSVIQPYRIEVFPGPNIVTATPQISGAPVSFTYDEASGEGLKKINELLVALEVEEGNPSVTFTEYVSTGVTFLPDAIFATTTGIIWGSATVDGVPAEVVINQNVSPWMVTVSVSGYWPLMAPVFSESGYAPFPFGDILYAVEPDAPSIGTFQVHKWVRCSYEFTNCIYVAPAPASNVSHLLLSEVQVGGSLVGTTTATTNDFIELYNPTASGVNLNGYRLVKRTASSTTDTLIKSWTSAEFIPAFGHYLWANSGYAMIGVTPDATTTQSIADNNGIALKFGTTTIIDSVAWGTAANGFTEATNLPGGLLPNQSYERRAYQGIICFSAQGLTALLGNGCDQGVNATDFEVRSVSEPQNTGSAREP